MPGVNWDVFAGLPGAVQTNFEMLCRALVHRHYGQYGDFRALAAQPGVEFHLRLHTECALGQPGRWWGWQCRWYGLPSGRALGNTRRRKIKEAIETTLAEVGVLDDWVLWTRYPLTEGDQKWFYGLNAGGMRLTLWTAEKAEDLLSGTALALRQTYFGDLALTADDLSKLREQSIAPILSRWMPEVHQVVDAERTVRGLLAGTRTRRDLDVLAERLSQSDETMGRASASQNPAVPGQVACLRELLVHAARHLSAVSKALQDGDLPAAAEQAGRGPQLDRQHHDALRALRSTRHPAAAIATNAIADIRLARRLLDDLGRWLDTYAIAVIAGAGCGKTQLAAQLTKAEPDRPAGVLLRGGDLRAGASLDDLAERVIIRAAPCPSMEALLEAVNAAGQRAGRRLPVVIDGLNESEDPRNWNVLLASLHRMLPQFPYVVFMCTLRPEFADECLPADFARTEIPGFGADTPGAVRRYLGYYRIDARDAELPAGILSHPLSLRLFCEVTNPARERTVGVEAIPASLTAVFDRYLEQVAKRISDLSPTHCRRYPPDVRNALERMGTELWERHSRAIEVNELRELLDGNATWDCSLVRALEQEGVLLRMPGETSGAYLMAVSYDSLAGHLIGDAILARRGRDATQAWLQENSTVEALAGDPPIRHPLASDVLSSLTALLPRRQQRQLWPIIDIRLREQALRQAADLEATYLDAATIDELAELTRRGTPGIRDMLWRLLETRAALAHPLNASFLDAVLRQMSVADRDLRWTEWTRRHQQMLLADLTNLEDRWRASHDRTDRDVLLARWATWLLTSTVRKLRDQATRSLYWYGRGNPGGLFALTLDALAINDPYVPERLLAASYGITMAHQLRDETVTAALREYLAGLQDGLTGGNAAHPTSHWLARLYVQGTAALATKFYPETVPGELLNGDQVPFAAGPAVQPIRADDPRAEECRRTLGMDFENYTLGSLFEDRGNYDMEHHGHKEAVAHVLGTVWELGWREDYFGSIDAEIARMGQYEASAPATERYGKKYGWIGYYTAAGQLDDRNELTRGERMADVHIDPSFPEPPPPAPIALPDWARPTPADLKRWVRSGVVQVPSELLCNTQTGPGPGRWIAVNGFLETADQAPGRRVWGFLTAILVEEREVDRLETALRQRPYPGRYWLPEPPEDHYTFGGEIPWHPDFGLHAEDDRWPSYGGRVRVDGDPPISVEILAHQFGWESYHSVLNQAGNALVPSRSFSDSFRLHGLPQVFHQAESDARLAAMSYSAPSRFSGKLLYLREDLLADYAQGRVLIWFLWGERVPHPHPTNPPQWLIAVRQANAGVWRHIDRHQWNQ